MLTNKKNRLIKACLITTAFFSSMHAYANFNEKNNQEISSSTSQLVQVPNEQTNALTKDDSFKHDAIQNNEMYYAINEYYSQLGYSFKDTECLVEQKETLLFEQQPLTYNLTTSSCANFLLSEHDIDEDQSMAFLVQIDLKNLGNENKSDSGLISIKSEASHQPLIQREIILDGFQDTDKELIVIGNNCSKETCDAMFDVKSLNAFAELEVTIRGVFYAEKTNSNELSEKNGFATSTLSNAKTSGFQNGDFSQYGTGWNWKRDFIASNNCTTNSPYLGDFGDSLNPIILTLNGTNNVAAAGGGFASLGGFNERYQYNSIAQTVQVNSNTRLKFRRNLIPGRSGTTNIARPVSMMVRAFDITTGNNYYAYQRSTSNTLNFGTITSDIDLLWNHTVRFSFNVCSYATSQTPFSDTHGQMRIDDVRLEPFTPVSPSGTLSTDSPCTLVAGSNHCSVQLNATTSNSPINCLWLSQPQISLVSCTGDAQFSQQWDFANTTGQTFDLRSHNSFPGNTNADFSQSMLLDQAQVIALPAPTPDAYDDVSVRGFSDDVPGDAERLFGGAPAQQHNFHDQGDLDWMIFAMGTNVATISTTVNGDADALLRVYEVTGQFTNITPDRWDITQSDLTLRGSDTSSGNNTVTVQNDSSAVKVYVVRVSSSGPFGNNTDYTIKSTVVNPDAYDNATVRGFSDDVPGDAERLFAGTPQQHNFHDQGDIDWMIFGTGNGSITVSTELQGNAVAQLRIYEVTGDFAAITPDRWDITQSDLTLRDSDGSAGNNAVTVTNNTNEAKFYVVRVNSAGPYGNNTDYTIKATVN